MRLLSEKLAALVEEADALDPDFADELEALASRAEEIEEGGLEEDEEEIDDADDDEEDVA